MKDKQNKGGRKSFKGRKTRACVGWEKGLLGSLGKEVEKLWVTGGRDKDEE